MKHAAFIRNIMVGRKGLTREVLVTAFEQAGAIATSSFLATGNFIFVDGERSSAEIAVHVSRLLFAQTGLREPIFVRSLHDLARLAASDPFANAPVDNICDKCITFLPDNFPDLDHLPTLTTRRDAEIYALIGGAAFSVTRSINGRTGSPGAMIERQTGLQVTTRNWNTVVRLLDKYTG